MDSGDAGFVSWLLRVISSAVFARDSNSAVIIKGLEIDATSGVNSPSLFGFL